VEKIREKKLVYYIENRSIKISFILYVLISLVVGITISVRDTGRSKKSGCS
jgi:hypothetical protein